MILDTAQKRNMREFAHTLSEVFVKMHRALQRNLAISTRLITVAAATANGMNHRRNTAT